MKSVALGQRTSPVEVTNVSPHGFWLFVDARELFVSFNMFPWFKEASIREISNVTLPSPHHLHWPDLDVDLAVESLDHPDKFPLISKAPLGRTARAPKTREKAGNRRVNAKRTRRR